MSVRRHGDLEIDDDPRSQRRIWAFQSWGRGAIALLLVTAALGVLGPSGPLSGAKAGGPASALGVARADGPIPRAAFPVHRG